MGQAQGSLEYMLLIGGAIVIAVAAIALLLGTATTSQKSTEEGIDKVELQKIQGFTNVDMSGTVQFFRFEKGTYVVSDNTRGNVANFTGTYITHSTGGMNPKQGTVMGWVYPTQPVSWGFWQTRDEGGADWPEWIGMFAWPTSNFYFRIVGTPDLIFPTSYITTNQWNHLAFTWGTQGGANVKKVYINGVDKGSVTTASFPNGIDPNARLGQTYNFPTQGKLDDVIIMNRALSGQEIFSIYNYQKK